MNAMFSEATLAANVAAIQRAQGQCPAFGALDPSRVRAIPDDRAGIRLELRTGDGDWLRLDDLSTTTFPQQLFVIGPALGTVMDAIERAGAPTRVVALEPDPGVAVLMLSRRDWTSWFDSGRLRLLTGPDYRGAVTCSRHVNVSDPPLVLEHPLLAEHRAADLAAARAVATQMIAEAGKNQEARRRFAGRYLLQTLANLPVIAREGDAGVLDGRFSGCPAVVLGAGPSLDENLPALAELQDRAVIVAADTALRPLVKGGVRPHILVGVDPGEMNAKHLAGVADIDDVHLVAEGSLNPIAFDGFANRTFTFKVSNHDPWPWLATRGLGRTTLRAWGSVVTSAFDLALRLGCNPIIFAGLDLAFTNMRPYCRGTIYHEMWQSYVDQGSTWEGLAEDYFRNQPDIRMPDWKGAETRTTPAMISFRNWLLEQTAGTTDRSIFNATGGGILYGPGLRHASLHELLGASAPLAAVRERLVSAHRQSASRSTSIQVDVEQLLRAEEPELFARWREFTLNTVTDAQITSALQTASSRSRV